MCIYRVFKGYKPTLQLVETTLYSIYCIIKYPKSQRLLQLGWPPGVAKHDSPMDVASCSQRLFELLGNPSYDGFTVPCFLKTCGGGLWVSG